MNEIIFNLHWIYHYRSKIYKIIDHSLVKCTVLMIEDTQDDINIIFLKLQCNCNLQAVQERTLKKNKPSVFWKKRA